MCISNSRQQVGNRYTRLAVLLHYLSFFFLVFSTFNVSSHFLLCFRSRVPWWNLLFSEGNNPESFKTVGRSVFSFFFLQGFGSRFYPFGKNRPTTMRLRSLNVCDWKDSFFFDNPLSCVYCLFSLSLCSIFLDGWLDVFLITFTYRWIQTIVWLEKGS